MHFTNLKRHFTMNHSPSTWVPGRQRCPHLQLMSCLARLSSASHGGGHTLVVPGGAEGAEVLGRVVRVGLMVELLVMVMTKLIVELMMVLH